MTTTEQSADLVIVGSGGGGLVAALAAHDAGLRPLVIEKQPYAGGSTGMSGGILWLPDNPLMRAEGVPDSREAGLAYFESVVGPPDAGSSAERRLAFLTRGSEMVSFLQGAGIRLVRCEGYSDYYDNRDGGSARGRSIEAIPWDGKQLGDWHDKVIPGMGRGLGMTVKTNEVRSVPVFSRAPSAFAIAARVVARTYLGRLRGKDLFTNGMSLVGQLVKILRDRSIPLWLNTSFTELVVEGGQVVGVRAERDGAPVLIRGTKGVLLAAGGFERNAEMRRKYSGNQPNEAQWTVANPGNTGDALAAALALGAKSDYLDEAVWLPGPRPELGGSSLAVGRQYPRAILVNQHGKRFVNESNSYLEVGKAMYANDAVPAWLIFDDEFRRRYPWARNLPPLRKLASVLPGRMPSQWIADGWIKSAGTLRDLAALIDVDPDTLAGTVERFNTHAATGTDPDFGRGESQYNRVLGDPGNRPNPCLGPIDAGPFYATEIRPGDVGTFGGVVTNEHAQVLDEADTPIPGLYATGNMTATVMGRTYPGAGASIAGTMVFGYIAAHHAANG